ncbi:MAG: hypothetical protein AAF420_06460 [Pseudomonadota bacterium]
MKRLYTYSLLLMLAVPVTAWSNASELAATEFQQVDDDDDVLLIDGSRIEIHYSSPSLLSIRERLRDWIGYSAQAVQHYYGRFPVKRVSLSLLGFDGGGVDGGRQMGGELPILNVTVGSRSSVAELRDDWIMVHEMVHLALADLPQYNRWLEEGLAVYVESVARAQVGHIDEDFVWRGFLRGMPHGMPRSGDRGLNFTPTWGRTYWGGGLFCLLADIEIRKLTNNRYSLRDALRAIINNGYSTNVDSHAQPLLEVADAAVGVDVLVPLYDKMSKDPGTPTLDSIWKSLGVSLNGDRVVYDDQAPLAHIRRALLVTPADT